MWLDTAWAAWSPCNAGRHAARVASLLVIDSAVVRDPAAPPITPRPAKFYPTLEDGLAAFRLRPRGTCAPADRLRAVGRHGLVRTSDGWRWKFDPVALHHLDRAELDESIDAITAPVTFLAGAFSEIDTRATVEHLADVLGDRFVFEIAENSYHHVTIDEPHRTVEVIRASIARGPQPPVQ